MATRIGVCGRNQDDWPEIDFQLIRHMRAGVVKMMSHTRPHVFSRLSQENPDMLIITRLYDDRLTNGHSITPFEFAKRMTTIIASLLPYCQTFQIHNEPNHRDGIEGWGCGDSDAVSFARWFNEAYGILKAAFPQAAFGFPGLALPDFAHRDRRWLTLCASAIQKADWLGCHCYWQSPPGQDSVINHPDFGKNYEAYHQAFPGKPLHILECGNSNCQNNYPLSDDQQAEEYAAWSATLPGYVASASFFIASSPDPFWDGFAFREGGRLKPVVNRLALYRGRVLNGEPEPVNLPKLTNQQVINIFSFAATELGLPQWDIMNKAGVSLLDLAGDRQGIYTGPPLDELPIGEAEQQAITRQVESLQPTNPPTDEDLATRYGIEPAVIEAVFKIETGGSGFGADGRVKIRFENHIFWDKWGVFNVERYNHHFLFDISTRWTGHKWRPDGGAWRDCHISQDVEYQVLNFARELDDTAPLMSISMGLGQIMGFNHRAAGYDTVQEMFEAMQTEAGQREAFLNFVVSNKKRLEALRKKDWRAFALYYNGAGNVDVYSKLLSEAYQRVVSK